MSNQSDLFALHCDGAQRSWSQGSTHQAQRAGPKGLGHTPSVCPDVSRARQSLQPTAESGAAQPAVGVARLVCMYEYICGGAREKERERECAFWGRIGLYPDLALLKTFSVEIAFFDEMMVIIIIIMCFLSKIKAWHPCLFIQLVFFYLCVKS